MQPTLSKHLDSLDLLNGDSVFITNWSCFEGITLQNDCATKVVMILNQNQITFKARDGIDINTIAEIKFTLSVDNRIYHYSSLDDNPTYYDDENSNHHNDSHNDTDDTSDDNENHSGDTDTNNDNNNSDDQNGNDNNNGSGDNNTSGNDTSDTNTTPASSNSTKDDSTKLAIIIPTAIVGSLLAVWGVSAIVKHTKRTHH